MKKTIFNNIKCLILYLSNFSISFKKIFIKHKLIKIILVPLFFSLFLQCSVNEYIGLIEVYNYTNTPVKNVKIGDTLLAIYVAPGNYVDYWFSSDIKGKLYSEGVTVGDAFSGITYDLKANYWIQIIARENSDGSNSVGLSYQKNGTTYNQQNLTSN